MLKTGVIDMLLVCGLVVGGCGNAEEQKQKQRQLASQIRKAALDIKSMETAIKVFESDCGDLPKQLEGLLVQPTDLPAGKWKGPYLEQENELPKDPWGNPYKYVCPGSHKTGSFDLYSFGPDGQDGGSDDIDNWMPPR